MRTTVRAVALAAAGGMAQLSAQQPAAPTFRAGVELVRLDVRVTDADGRPLKDLRQDEIEVVEDGEPRPVVLFQHVQEPAESFLEAARHTTAGEVSTNRGAARGHLYVIVFDQQHISPGNELRARQAAQRFVSTKLAPGDRVALYALPGPGPQIGFIADARRLAAALNEVHGAAEPELFGAISSMTRYEAFEIVRGNETILQRVTERVQALGTSDVERRVNPAGLASGGIPLTALVTEDARKIADMADAETRAMLARLSDVIRPMRAIEGRKSILFVSEGFEGDRLTREIEAVAAAAAESYSVVYALDINRREGDVTASAPVGSDQAHSIHNRIAPLGTMAAETGGAMLIDAAVRADAVFASIADQSQDYYLVGFPPTPQALNRRGEYRRVSVRVKRPGARVASRTGFALADDGARIDKQQAIRRAMSAPFPLQGIPIEYTTYVVRGSTPDVQSVLVSLAAELPVASANEKQPADVAFVVRSAVDGNVAASGHDVIALPARPANNASTGIGIYRVQFELRSGEYLMRTVVREPGGSIGTADRRFKVRALDGPAIEMGDLIIGSGTAALPVRPVAYTADGLSGAFELYARTAEQLRQARVTVDLVPIGESAPVISASPDLADVRSTSRGVTREARIALPLSAVAPGAYLARARITVGSDTVTESLREVDVRHGVRPSADTDEPTEAFDPREVVNGAVGRAFAERVGASPVASSAAQGRIALDKLAAADYAAAIAALSTIAEADKSNAAAASFLLGWAYHGAGQDRQAISAWRRAAFLDPSLVAAHLALVDMYIRLQQPELALQAARAGLAALPDSPELRDRLSRLERR